MGQEETKKEEEEEDAAIPLECAARFISTKKLDSKSELSCALSLSLSFTHTDARTFFACSSKPAIRGRAAARLFSLFPPPLYTHTQFPAVFNSAYTLTS